MATKEQRHEYYLKNKEYLKKKALDWNLNNPERKQETSRKYRENNISFRLWQSCRNTAKTRGIEFNLSIEDIIIPETCPYLKHKITNIIGEGRIWSNPSIDRIDPSKGYTKDNIEIISLKANNMKLHATREELINFAQTIKSRYD